MPYNPTHYRKTWAALGNPLDPVAFDVAGPRSAISLLKGLLAEFGGPFLPNHSVSLDKLQQVVGPTVLGRGAGLGDVLALALGRGLSITTTITHDVLATTTDVALKSENNFWTLSNAFAGGLTALDNTRFAINNESDQSKVLRFDVSTLPTGNTLRVRMPSVGLEGGPDIGYLGLLKGIGDNFAQPLDDDLTALSNLSAVNTIYYRSGNSPPAWSPVVIGAGLLFLQGTLSATGGGGGGGGVNTAGPVNASMLAGYADATGNLIQGVMVAGPGIAYASGLLQTTHDLFALENLTGTNTIYYRAAVDTWSPVTFSTGLTFTGGALTLAASLQALGAVAMVADTVPYFTGVGTAAGTALTAFGRSLVGTADAAAALTLLGAQPIDTDLTALAALTGTNTIYYRSGTGTWSPVTIGANLTFGGGVLAATGSGGGGVTTSGPVTSAMLTGYADSTGNLIRGITMPGAGLTLTGAALTLANDLSALEALSGTNTIYYRSGVDAWSAVTIGTNLSFAGGVLSAAAGGGGVSTTGPAVTASMLTGYADASGTLIRGINLPAAGIALSGNTMVLTNDLASLESASATGALYYRSAADTWSTVTVGGGLGFTTGNLTITNVALTALGSLTPAADRLPYFTGATTAALATFTAAGRTLLQQPDAPAMVGVLGAQPLDGDLTSLAGATGTNTIYYRSAISTWSPVVVGTNLSFTGGTLAATGGGGDVFKNLTNTFTQVNYFSGAAPNVVIGHTASLDSAGLQIQGAPGAAGDASITKWNPAAIGPELAFKHSRNGTIGVHTALATNDSLGAVTFWGSNGTAFVQGAAIKATADGAPGTAAPSSLRFSIFNATTETERLTISSAGQVNITGNLIVSGTISGAGGNVVVRKFITSGPYVPTAGMKSCIIEAVAGGGAGGSISGSNTGLYMAGGGGGSGGYSRKYATAADIGASQPVTIGVGGIAQGGADGLAGGDTSVGTLCIAKGGFGGSYANGGANSIGTGGPGGVPGTGDIAAAGASGGNGGWSNVTALVPGGEGGSSIFGGGASGVATNGAAVNGLNASNYGSGASGGCTLSQASVNPNGGNGSPGIVIITEFT